MKKSNAIAEIDEVINDVVTTEKIAEAQIVKNQPKMVTVLCNITQTARIGDNIYYLESGKRIEMTEGDYSSLFSTGAIQKV